MKLNNFYHKELVIALFVLLGVNPCWQWFESETQPSHNLAISRTRTVMIELASSNPTQEATQARQKLRERNCSVGFWACKIDAFFNGKFQEPEIKEGSGQKEGDNKKPENSGKASDLNKKQVLTIKNQTGGENTYEVDYEVIQGISKTFTTITVTDTQAGVECEDCGADYTFNGEINLKDEAFLKEFTEKQLIPLIKKDLEKNAVEKEAAKTAQKATSTSEQSTSPKIVIAGAEEAGDAKAEKVAVATAEGSKVESIEEKEEVDEAELAQQYIDGILKKCESYSEKEARQKYLSCLSKQMISFSKINKNKSLKSEIFDEIYTEYIKDDLFELAKSEDEKDNTDAVKIAINLKALFLSKSLAPIKNQLKDLVVGVESRQFGNQLTEDVKPVALAAANAYQNWQDALSHNDFAKANRYQVEYQNALNILNGFGSNSINTKWANNKLRLRDEPEWDLMAKIYGEGEETKVDRLMNEIYNSAGKYKTGIYDALLKHSSIDDLLENAINGTPSSLGSANIGSSTIAGIVGSNSIYGRGGRNMRDGAANLFANSGSSSQYPGNRGGRQSVSNNYRSNDFGGGSPNSSFQNWGSVTPEYYRGNSNIASNYQSNNNNYNPSINYRSNNSYNYNNTQGNCRYSSYSPVSYSGSNCNSGNSYQSGYPGSGAGGRFGNGGY